MKSGAGDDPFSDEEVEQAQEQTETDRAADEDVVEHEQVGDVVVQEHEDQPLSMVDVIASNLEDIEEGDLDNNIGIRHDRLKALLAAVDDSPELAEELVALGDAVGKDWDAGDLTASDVGRAAMFAGLQEEAPAALEALEEAKSQHDSLL